MLASCAHMPCNQHKRFTSSTCQTICNLFYLDHAGAEYDEELWENQLAAAAAKVQGLSSQGPVYPRAHLLLYYRTDWFEELGASVPNTWCAIPASILRGAGAVWQLLLQQRPSPLSPSSSSACFVPFGLNPCQQSPLASPLAAALTTCCSTCSTGLCPHTLLAGAGPAQVLFVPYAAMCMPFCAIPPQHSAVVCPLASPPDGRNPLTCALAL
eukprot:1143316-Pelagomonas_calceolata.AAC.1